MCHAWISVARVCRWTCGSHSYTVCRRLSFPYSGWVVLIPIQQSGCSHSQYSCRVVLISHIVVGWFSFPYSCRVVLIPIFVRARLYIRDELQGKQKIIECVTRGSVSVVWLSFLYSCRAALIPIQRSDCSHSHTVVGWFSFPYSCRAVLIPIVRRFSFCIVG